MLHTEKTIKTFKGHYIDVFDPNPEHIDIEDIAHALSNQPRWSGHTIDFYSVAEHSIRVANICPIEHRLEALLHDATEAYLCDIPKPIKRHLPDYVKLEKSLDKAIRAKFGIQSVMTPLIKEADKHQLEWEWNHVKHHKYPPYAGSIKSLFLQMFNEYK